MRVQDLEQGHLPAVCAKTGAPCDLPVKDTLRVVPRWVSALAVFAVVPYFVGRAYTSRRIVVLLPVAPERLERIRRLVRGAWFALALAAAGSSAALFGAGIVGVVARVAGLFGYLLVVYIGDQMWVGARPSGRDDVVILTRVDPAFARALDAMYAQLAADGSANALPADY